MFHHNAQRTLTAVVGAVLLSSTFVAAAVAPARAVETAPVQLAQVQLSDEARA